MVVRPRAIITGTELHKIVTATYPHTKRTICGHEGDMWCVARWCTREELIRLFEPVIDK